MKKPSDGVAFEKEKLSGRCGKTCGVQFYF